MNFVLLVQVYPTSGIYWYRVRFCQSEGQVSCLGHLLWTRTVNMLPWGTQILFSILFGAAGCANWKGLGSVHELNLKLYGQKL